jgi:hypothetical protein
VKEQREREMKIFGMENKKDETPPEIKTAAQKIQNFENQEKEARAKYEAIAKEKGSNSEEAKLAKEEFENFDIQRKSMEKGRKDELKKAQEKYNIIVERTGKNSDEAKAAMKDMERWKLSDKDIIIAAAKGRSGKDQYTALQNSRMSRSLNMIRFKHKAAIAQDIKNSNKKKSGQDKILDALNKLKDKEEKSS